ncbi:MAG: ABC transporter ATP-binding protein [Microthrixaceae bacterium]
MSFGPPAGSPFGAPGAGSALPFAGMPPELAERAEAILEREPEHPPPGLVFDQRPPDGRRLTLRRFLATHSGKVALAGVLVVIETLALQAGPFLTQQAIDRGMVPQRFDIVARMAAIYVGAVVVSTLVGAARVAWTARLGEQLMYQLRVRVFAHLQRLSLEYFTGEKAGVIMTRMTSDIDNLTALFQEGLVQMAVQGLTVVVISGVLVAYDPLMAAVTLLLVVPVLIGLTLWYRRASTRAYDDVRDTIAAVLSDLSEGIGGIRTVIANNRGRQNSVIHANLAGRHLAANRESARVGAIYGPSAESLGYLGQAVLLVLGATRIRSGQLEIGELFAFLLYLNLFFGPIQQLVQLYTTYQQGQASIRKLADLLDTPPAQVEAPDAVELPPVEGEVVFHDVTYGYEPDRAVLEHLNLAVRAGETLALVGPTGAGKTTLTKLVARFGDPQRGRVTVDGHDIAHVTFASLRRQVTGVPQEPFLFAGTIRDNLAFARSGASEAELQAAAHAVGLGELVDRLPEGLDTVIHERGVSLSAGERQLLALARAMVAAPRVLILDEATSNLDLRTEARIDAALDVALADRTALVIAHRLATARRADRIAVIDRPSPTEGARVIELGTHAELVAAGGRYAAMNELWERQSAGDAVAADPTEVGAVATAD